MENEKDIVEFANTLYNNLKSRAPRRTHNLVSNITYQDLGDRIIITISKGVPYARAVNYNWGRRTRASQRRYMNARKDKPQREKNNYLWVERTIQSTANNFFGKERVVNELQGIYTR